MGVAATRIIAGSRYDRSLTWSGQPRVCRGMARTLHFMPHSKSDPIVRRPARIGGDLAMSNGGAETWEAMVTLVEYLEPSLQAVEDSLPNGVPARTWDAIATGARSQARRFREGKRSIDKEIR
jgi:hypothetical protein